MSNGGYCYCGRPMRNDDEHGDDGDVLYCHPDEEGLPEDVRLMASAAEADDE